MHCHPAYLLPMLTDSGKYTLNIVASKWSALAKNAYEMHSLLDKGGKWVVGKTVTAVMWYQSYRKL